MKAREDDPHRCPHGAWTLIQQIPAGNGAVKQFWQCGYCQHVATKIAR